MKVVMLVMDGEATLSGIVLIHCSTSWPLDCKTSADAIWDALSMVQLT